MVLCNVSILEKNCSFFNRLPSLSSNLQTLAVYENLAKQNWKDVILGGSQVVILVWIIFFNCGGGKNYSV